MPIPLFRSLILAVPMLLSLAATVTAQSADPAEKRNSAARQGGLIGLAAGGIALPTIVYIRTERRCAPVRGTIHACDDEWDPALLAMMYGGIGGAIGAGVGALIGRQIDRQRAGKGKRLPRRVELMPVVDRTRRGMAVSFSF